MPFLIAGAILLGSAYQANQARQANRAAREQQAIQLQQQERDAAAMREEINRQTTAYGQQAAALQTQAETKAREVQAAADEERRKAAAAEASALKARTRGGRRSLLSQERLTPELGVTTPQLGSGMML
jgi:hypothetical protein